MPTTEQRHSRRFHITLQISNLQESIQEYSEILGEKPCCVVPERLALWRTKELNFLLRAKARQRTAVLQLGWEYDYLEKTQRFKDRNLLSWLFFSTTTQDEAINRLNTELEYDEKNDFLLELRNPNAKWNLWASILIIVAMGIFTILNREWLHDFFRPQDESRNKAAQTLQENTSANAQLKVMGALLEKADYSVSYLDSYAVAQHPKHASITFQIINQQVLFSTYWALKSSDIHFIQDNINAINREAIFCRYYVDEQNDLAVEAWFPLPFFFLQNNQTAPASDGETQQQEALQAALQAQIQAQAEAQVQAQAQWQKTLKLWQQESYSWIQDSPLFGGNLRPKQSFSKR